MMKVTTEHTATNAYVKNLIYSHINRLRMARNRNSSGESGSNSESGSASSTSSRSCSPLSSHGPDHNPKATTSQRKTSGCSFESKKSQSPKSNDSKKSIKVEANGRDKKQFHDSDDSVPQIDLQKRKKQHQLIDSDSEPDDELQRTSLGISDQPTATALFGDASDISTDDEYPTMQPNSIESEEIKGEKDDEENGVPQKRIRSRSRSQSHSCTPSRSRSGSRAHSEEITQSLIIKGEDEKDKQEELEPPPETRIDVEIPKISTDLGREIHFLKLPNFLSVETRPFDHDTYEDEIDEEETLDEEGRARLKLKVENTIRWRETFIKQGKIEKESNARFVKWSDGSMSLHLGSEIFDVYKQPLQGDHNHLYIRQGTGLQGQAVFRTKLTFRPHSTESFTHRKMTMSLADRSQKTSGIKVLSHVGMNPDQNKYEMIKKEEEKLRLAMRVQTKSKKPSGGSRGTNRTTAAYENPYHDEGSDDDNAISLAAIKNKYKKGGGVSKLAQNIYSSDEEGSDFEAGRPKKHPKSKVLEDSDEDSKSGSEEENSASGDENEKVEQVAEENESDEET